MLLGELIGVATAKKDGLMPMEQFFDRDVNPIEDYNNMINITAIITNFKQSSFLISGRNLINRRI